MSERDNYKAIGGKLFLFSVEKDKLVVNYFYLVSERDNYKAIGGNNLI